MKMTSKSEKNEDGANRGDITTDIISLLSGDRRGKALFRKRDAKETGDASENRAFGLPIVSLHTTSQTSKSKRRHLINIAVTWMLMCAYVIFCQCSYYVKQDLFDHVNSPVAVVPVAQCEDIRAGLDYLGQINQDLEPFLEHGINEALLDESFHSVGRAVKVYIRDNRIFVEFKEKEENEAFLNPRKLSRWRGAIAVLLKASCFINLPDVDLIMYMPDKISSTVPTTLPFFHFQKTRNGKGILIPYMSHNSDLRAFQDLIDKDPKYNWEAKKSKLIWRGSSTGGHFNTTNYASFPRSKLVLECENDPNLKEYCDAGFINFVQLENPDDKVSLERKFPLQSAISMEDHMMYKYIAWLDGNGPCSGRSEKLMLGNSLLLKAESQEIEFYYMGLKANKHYLPIQANMSNLVDQMAWARSHNEEALEIVTNMRTFSRQLSPKSLACYLQGLLQQYATLLTYNLKPVSELQDARAVLPGKPFQLAPGTYCANPIYACREYLLVRNKTWDSRTTLLGANGGDAVDMCHDFFPMFPDQIAEYKKAKGYL